MVLWTNTARSSPASSAASWRWTRPPRRCTVSTAPWCTPRAPPYPWARRTYYCVSACSRTRISSRGSLSTQVRLALARRRNTWVLDMWFVIFCVHPGHESKAMLNNGGPRYKRSKLERQMNMDIIWCVVILIVLCVVGAVGCRFWLQGYDPEESIPFIPNLIQRTPSCEGFLAFWTFIIILQVSKRVVVSLLILVTFISGGLSLVSCFSLSQIMIPLSLYVSIEMTKLAQVYHIHHNKDLYDPLTDKRIECRALNITEELGQVCNLGSICLLLPSK